MGSKNVKYEYWELWISEAFGIIVCYMLNSQNVKILCTQSTHCTSPNLSENQELV